MFDLSGKKITFVVALFFAVAGAFAQRASGNYNYLGFEQKPYFFGITLAYNVSDYKVFYSKNFILNDSIRRAESITGPGFNLGFCPLCHLPKETFNTPRPKIQGCLTVAGSSPSLLNFPSMFVTNLRLTKTKECS